MGDEILHRILRGEMRTAYKPPRRKDDGQEGMRIETKER